MEFSEENSRQTLDIVQSLLEKNGIDRLPQYAIDCLLRKYYFFIINPLVCRNCKQVNIGRRRLRPSNFGLYCWLTMFYVYPCSIVPKNFNKHDTSLRGCPFSLEHEVLGFSRNDFSYGDDKVEYESLVNFRAGTIRLANQK